MKPQIPWLRVLVEGVVIVGSILLAFGIDAWWSERQERAEEREILLGLHEELVENQESLRWSLAAVEGGLGHLRRFLDMTPDQAAEIPPDSALNWVVTPHERVYSISLSGGFREAVVSSGKLALIKDSDLRAEIAGVTRGYENALEVLEYCNDLSRDAMSVMGEYPEVQNLTAIEPNRGRISGQTLRALRNDTELVGLTVSKARYWRGYQGELRLLWRHISDVIASIEAELEARW